jgi:uncharacterized protein (TIGR02271 family)
MQGEQRGQNEARMTRSEEELRVGKREADAGQVRLRKVVETEPVSADVDLRRETASIERHEVNQPARPGQIGEQEATLDLQREDAVVQKDAIVKEEVTARKQEETRTETIEEDVRKERIEVDDDQQKR